MFERSKSVWESFDNVQKLSLIVMVILTLLGIFGPVVAPYQYNDKLMDEEGKLKTSEPPSFQHILGTNDKGEDVLSRLLFGSRPTLIVGFVGGILIVTIGFSIGGTAGYFGGQVENILMRFTDGVYGLPIIPFSIVLLSIVGFGFWTAILIIGLILWRGNARVFRSEVLQIKEQPYVKISRSMGGSHVHIMTKHIIPNMKGMIAIFFAFGVAGAILLQAGLAFLGVSSPFLPTWGVMIRNAFSSGFGLTAWWWIMPPGIVLSAAVTATLILGRSLETSAEEQIID